MKVLVTGSAGMVGGHVMRYLAANGHETIGTDIAGGANAGNVADRDFVFGVLGKLDFEAVVHLAAVTNIGKTIEDPYRTFEVNCFGTLNMLELGRRKAVRRFLYPSSANVYGAPKRNPVREEEPVSPRLPYDYSKAVGETLALGYQATSKLPVSITRSWLLFGEGDLPNRAVPRFVTACLRNEPVTLFNSGKDVTAPSHVENYAKLVRLILENESSIGEIFNFGGDESLSVLELAERIRNLCASTSKLIMLPPRSERESEPQVSYPSMEKTKRLLGYTPALSLEEGLKRTIASYREGSGGRT